MFEWLVRLILPPKPSNSTLAQRADRILELSRDMQNTFDGIAEESRKAQRNDERIHRDNILERELLYRRIEDNKGADGGNG